MVRPAEQNKPYTNLASVEKNLKPKADMFIASTHIFVKLLFLRLLKKKLEIINGTETFRALGWTVVTALKIKETWCHIIS